MSDNLIKFTESKMILTNFDKFIQFKKYKLGVVVFEKN